MAKLVAVCRDEADYSFERRQIPLNIEDTLTMVMEIPETVISTRKLNEDELQSFSKRFHCLNAGDLSAATTVRQKDVLSFLSHSVPCVGCRRRWRNCSCIFLFLSYLLITFLRWIIYNNMAYLGNVGCLSLTEGALSYFYFIITIVFMSSFRKLLCDINISIIWWIIPDIVPVQYRQWTNIMFTCVRKKLLNGQ